MSGLTVGELIARLEDYDPETPVLIAHQPGWPLAEIVAGVTASSELEDDLDGNRGDDEETDTIWIVAGGKAWDRSPYAPGSVFEAVG